MFTRHSVMRVHLTGTHAPMLEGGSDEQLYYSLLIRIYKTLIMSYKTLVAWLPDWCVNRTTLIFFKYENHNIGLLDCSVDYFHFHMNELDYSLRC